MTYDLNNCHLPDALWFHEGGDGEKQIKTSDFVQLAAVAVESQECV